MVLRDERSLEVASFRYRVIADIIEVGGDAITAALRESAARTYLDPHSQERSFSTRTLWRWIAKYKSGGLVALCPKVRDGKGQVRAIAPDVLAMAMKLRRKKSCPATDTIIDILVRTKVVPPGTVARSTLDRHLALAGLSRRALGGLGKETFRLIETAAPFEFLVADFHHGPYVRVPHDDTLHKALLLAFIDHRSRFVPEARYYLHEDYAALRFGYRQLLAGFGPAEKLYVDNGPAFHATRFHAAVTALGTILTHSRPYKSEGRGLVERFNKTLKEQFENEVRDRDEPLSLDELNAYLEAWLSERYHRDIHSETGEAPIERFRREAKLKAAPEPDLVQELLRLRERRTVHKKWSTVEVATIRFTVDPSLRGRRLDVLYDPFDLGYVIIVFDGRVVQRAFPQKPGVAPPVPSPPPDDGPSVDYLALLRADYERRTQAELAALQLVPAKPAEVLSLVDLVSLLERCRKAALSPTEHSAAAAFWRRMRPIDPAAAQASIDRALRSLGTGLHLQVYLDALNRSLLHHRTKGTKKP